MLYVHDQPVIEEFSKKSKDEVLQVIDGFWAIRDDLVFQE